MKIILKWKQMEKPAVFDTKTMKLVDIPGRGVRPFGRDELDADMCIEAGGNLQIAAVHTGDVDSAYIDCPDIGGEVIMNSHGRRFRYLIVGFDNESRDKDWLYATDYINPIIEYLGKEE